MFSDDSFQDRLLSAATGKYLHLSNHLFKNTCLLIGLSLEDVTLQSLLRQNAVTNPGHVHYLVHFIRDNAEFSDEMKDAIFHSNFECYNLYTLFLSSTGIKALAELISKNDDDFRLKHGVNSHKFVYYLIGSIGSGKSTATSNLRSFITYDEWIDEREAELAVPEATLPSRAVKKINKWTAEQFRKKNYAIAQQPEGIHIIDRCPLDPLTFGLASDRQKKAINLYNHITNNGAESIEKGHLILLDCDVSDIRIRNSYKHKYWPDDKYHELLESIKEIYKPFEPTVVCTRGRSAGAVAHEIAKVVFIGDYAPTDVGDKLKLIGGAAT